MREGAAPFGGRGFHFLADGVFTSGSEGFVFGGSLAGNADFGKSCFTIVRGADIGLPVASGRREFTPILRRP